MNSSISFTTLFAGLAMGVSALAQAPSPTGPPPPLPTAQTGTGSFVTQSSRIRAFNPGPDGQVRSLYLSNGSVIDLPPDLGRTAGVLVRKGERVTVSGLRSNVYGQTIVAANSITLDGHNLLSKPDSGPSAEGNRLPPPPPPGEGPNRGRGPGRGPDMARLGPPAPNDRVQGQAPPPPQGPLAVPQGGPMPPPAPATGSQLNIPPPPVDPNAPAQLTVPAPPAVQPPAQTSSPTQPGLNGPAL